MISSHPPQQFAGTREQITKSLWSRRTTDFESVRMRRNGPGEAVLSLRSKRPVGLSRGVAPAEISGPVPSAHPATLAQREHNLRDLESRLVDRERTLADAESKLADREREIWEAEALFEARKQVNQGRADQDGTSVQRSSDGALEALRVTLEEQEKSLMAAKAALKDREEFLEASENKLFEKLQAQQEREIELEQWAEELGDKESALKRERGED